ncbi:MAG: histidine phosphatase family protein, partial [Vicinamibacteria bacterium]
MLTRARFMRILGPAVALLLTAAPYAAAQQAVIVVRHAEKADQTPDSALSPKGQVRAKALADLLRGAGVTHVITSEYLRTRETAAPLATALG